MAIIHHLKAYQRGIIPLCVAVPCYFINYLNLPDLVNAILCWSVYGLIYVMISWIIFNTTPLSVMTLNAKQEDGSRIYIKSIIMIAVAACIIAVLAIISNSKAANINLNIGISIFSLIISWILVHCIYAFHYARLYYQSKTGAGGLDFPGTKTPIYMDFVYFSFVIGCTFQVSDVNISSSRIRVVALYHGLLSFSLNTFIIALTINMVSGLIK